MAKEYRRFPIFWVIVLAFGLAWFFNELGIIDIDIPWLPLILIIVAIGAIFNRINR